MKILKLIVTVVIFAGCGYFFKEIVTTSLSNQAVKLDYAEINHIKYGLFSVNKWKEQLGDIISQEITKLDISKSQEKFLKKHVEVQLGLLIDGVAQKIKDSNRDTTRGKLKQAFINAFVDINAIKEGIPQYADTVVAQMTKAQTENKLKSILKTRIRTYLKKTYEKQDLSSVEQIVDRAGAEDVEEAKAKIDHTISTNNQYILHCTWILIGLACLLFSIHVFSRGKVSIPNFFLLVFTLILLLGAGVTVPMIDLEAKIAEMSFVLTGHPIKFLNQIFYFQSKGILDVFWLMIHHKDLQMKAVGVLVVMFSIFFPLFKIISSIFYYYDFGNLRNNKVIQFFVLKAGKWSMSDVLVVAIFMAYIGINGVIANQLSNFNAPTEDAVILTTNGTALQPGFFIFLSYVLLGLFFSGLVSRSAKETAVAPVEKKESPIILVAR